MHIFRIMLEVADLPRASAFYATLLGTPGRGVGGGRHYFQVGPVILGIVDVAAGGETPQPAPQDIYVSVNDLEAVHERAETLGCLDDGDVHGESAGAMVTRPWGERSFYAVDPFGNGLCFVDSQTIFTGGD